MYRKITTDVSAARRTARNVTLNRRGGKPVSFAVGDMVIAYVATAGQVQRGLEKESEVVWKKKHTIQWRASGPCRVVKKLSRSTYRVADVKTGASTTGLLRFW